jgi:enamine deaminase RidA (YjgF/YER057c/UK114 family)
MTTRDVVTPAEPHALYDLHRYSPAIRANGLLFVSGQVGSRPDGSPEPDFDEQVRLAFRNLNAILAAAGCSFSDVIDVTVFMVNPDTHFERAWAVAAEYWGEAPYPTATAVGVTWLAGFQFEIKVIAKLPDVASD